MEWFIHNNGRYRTSLIQYEALFRLTSLTSWQSGELKTLHILKGCLYLEHLFDLLSRQVDVEFVQELQDLADA